MEGRRPARLNLPVVSGDGPRCPRPIRSLHNRFFQTGPGQWQRSANGDEDGVVAGDAVTVGVTSDYEIEVVRESSDGDSSETLAVDDGPDA